MEIKSNNVLIGAFTVAVLLGIFVFSLWVGHIELNKQYSYYQIVFDGSVSGLGKSGAVQFNGLPVGRVVDLHLDEKDPNKVVALIQVDAVTPVKTDSVAQLELSGITGVAVIELTGGSYGSALLKPKDGETYATIQGAPSTLQELANAAPETLRNAQSLMHRFDRLLEDNQKSINQMLANLNQISGALAHSSGDMQKAIKDLADASGHIDSLSKNADALVKGQGKDFIEDAKRTSESYRRVADDLDRLIKSNGPAIDRLSHNGLSQLPQLVTEMRQLVSSLDRVVSRAQDDPARFLIGNNVPEVKAK